MPTGYLFWEQFSHHLPITLNFSEMKIKQLLYGLIFLLPGCISSYNLEHDTNEYLLVVDGKITQKDTRHELILRRSTSTGSTDYNPVSDARVTLYDDEGNHENYFPVYNGKYVLEGNVLDRVHGKSYYIEIILPDEILKNYLSEKAMEVFKNSNTGIYSVTVYADK